MTDNLNLAAFKRFCILGPPGSGKTTLSKKLHQLLQIPIVQMNELSEAFFRVYGRGPSEEEWRLLLVQVLADKIWITDGYMQATISTRLELADIVILLDIPLYRCLWNALVRGWRNLLGFSNTASAEYRQSIGRRIRYFFGIRTYKRIFIFFIFRRPALLQLLARPKMHQTILHIRSYREIKQILQTLEENFKHLKKGDGGFE